MTEEEALDYCNRGMHIRDDRVCIECGDIKGFLADHAELEANEPPPSSVVMTEGAHGTAWQRFRSDGRWHSTAGKSTTWERLLRNDRAPARTRIVYLPPTSS